MAMRRTIFEPEHEPASQLPLGTGHFILGESVSPQARQLIATHLEHCIHFCRQTACAHCDVPRI